MSTVSIIIPAKNEEQLLPRLLEDIRGQSVVPHEVIVADAFSTDQTRALAASYGAKVIDGGLPGPGRNRGAEVATGDILLFIDADSRLPSVHFLRDMLAEMERKKLDVASPRLTPLSRKAIDRAFFEIYNTFILLTEKLRPHAGGACIFVRRDAHQKLGGFNETLVYMEDMDYVQRAAKLGLIFGCLRSHPVATSVRRLEKDGRLMMALKFVYSEAHLLTRGAFSEAPFDYEMGGEDPLKKSHDHAT